MRHISLLRKKRSLTRAFTLIEVLVVISIIGVLSGVILVALNGARAKGVLGSAQTFYTHALTSAYSNPILYWKFDDVPNGSILSGTVTKDQSGQNMNGTFCNSSGGLNVCNSNSLNVTSVTASPLSSAGNSLAFTTPVGVSADYVISPVLPTSMPTYSVGAWVRPNAFGSTMGIFNMMTGIASGQASVTNGSWTQTYAAIKTTGQLNVYYWCSGGSEPAISINTDRALVANQWNYVAVSYDGRIAGQMNIQVFVNGVLDKNVTSTCTTVLPRYFDIGYTPQSTPGQLLGNIDEVFMSSNFLLSSDVWKLYALGATKHGLATQQ